MNIDNKQQTIICLMGPTAVGKTDVAVDWVQNYPCDIVSVDSALIYRGMDIGTAKPDAKTLSEAPHRLIDILDPLQTYSAANFCKDAVREIKAILAQDRIPLLVGGTMLYYRALQRGLSDLPEADEKIRQQLDDEIAEVGVVAMHQRLEKIDPEAAQRIKPMDSQRVQRALEVYQLTGKPLSELQRQKAKTLTYHFVNIGIIPEDRAVLHKRIEKRFYSMLEQGFIEEVKMLKNRGDLSLALPSMRTVGYRQIWQYLEGRYSKDEMIEKSISGTRQLAKRQLTWLRHWPNLRVYQHNSFPECIINLGF